MQFHRKFLYALAYRMCIVTLCLLALVFSSACAGIHQPEKDALTPALQKPIPAQHAEKHAPLAQVSPAQASPVQVAYTLAPTAERFSIIWLADTQTIAYHQDNDVFEAMGSWIMSHQEALNVRYIVQTGDLVDYGFHQRQWNSFDTLSRHFFGKIPYLPIAGNHDLGSGWDDYTAYLERPFVQAIPTERKFKNGQAAYATFRAGGLDFLLVGEGWNAGLAADAWVSDVLAAHRNSVAILLFHSYINNCGELDCERATQHDIIVQKHPNVRLALSGHHRGTGYQSEAFDDDGDGVADRTVNAMLYNYQGYTKIESGQLRVLTFDTQTRSIHVATYSPYSGKYYRDSYFREFEFDLKDAF